MLTIKMVSQLINHGDLSAAIIKLRFTQPYQKSKCCQHLQVSEMTNSQNIVATATPCILRFVEAKMYNCYCINANKVIFLNTIKTAY